MSPCREGFEVGFAWFHALDRCQGHRWDAVRAPILEPDSNHI